MNRQGHRVCFPVGQTTRLPMLSHRVLLAEDDLEVRQGIEDLLRPLGLEILHAETGPQAVSIALARRTWLHLMVLDFQMPGCTGLEVLSQVRQTLPAQDLPCIMYSGNASAELRAKALPLGASAVLRKPVAPEILRSEVLRALRRGDLPLGFPTGENAP